MKNLQTAGNEQLLCSMGDDFSQWGTDRYAYVREVLDSTGSTFVLRSADGTELGIFEKRDVAVAFASQHDLQTYAVN